MFFPVTIYNAEGEVKKVLSAKMLHERHWKLFHERETPPHHQRKKTRNGQRFEEKTGLGVPENSSATLSITRETAIDSLP